MADAQAPAILAENLRRAVGAVDLLGIHGDPLVPVRASWLLAAADHCDELADLRRRLKQLADVIAEAQS